MSFFSPAWLFAATNLLVLPAWALLLFAPRWRFTRLITAYVAPGALALLYLLIMMSRLGSSGAAGAGFGTLGQVARLYQDPWLLLAGWLHYLALDLFMGAWMVRDSQRLRIAHGYVLPCLLLTFVVGPVGLLAYFAVRAALIRRWPSTAPVTETVPKSFMGRGPVVGLDPLVSRSRPVAPPQRRPSSDWNKDIVRLKRLAFAVSFGLLLAALACSNSDQDRVKATSRGSYDPLTGKLQWLTYDRNKDGKVDTWVRMDGTRPIFSESDTDNDGVIDRWEFYGDHGELVRVGWRRAAPPKPGVVGLPVGVTPQAGTEPVLSSSPTASGEKPDAWAYMGPDGQPERVEFSEVSPTTGKDIITRREFYEHGKLVRAEEDTDEDGVMDKWESYVDGRLFQVEFDDSVQTTVTLDAQGTQRPSGASATHAGKPTRRLTYDASHNLVLIETEPDGAGHYLKKVVPGGKGLS